MLGNGLNILKVMPESAVKFGSYEVSGIELILPPSSAQLTLDSLQAAKRAIAKLEGHNDPKHIRPKTTTYHRYRYSYPTFPATAPAGL